MRKRSKLGFFEDWVRNRNKLSRDIVRIWSLRYEQTNKSEDVNK
jgi:hypothetical protein